MRNEDYLNRYSKEEDKDRSEREIKQNKKE